VIEQRAFAGTSVNEIVLPGGIVSISGSAFDIACLNVVSFRPLSVRFCVKDGFLRDISGRHLIRYFGRDSAVSVGIRVEVICESCFRDCKSIRSIVFDLNLKSKLMRIEGYAFCGSGLTAIHIPGSVEEIGEGCFSHCGSLSSVTFDSDSQLSRLDPYTFYESGITAIQIPASVEVICKYCFAGCRSLVALTFAANSKLGRIESDAFRECTLPSIRLPRSVRVLEFGWDSTNRRGSVVRHDWESRGNRWFTFLNHY
jgi:hypothetical protein